MARNIVETTTDMVIAEVKSKIASALADIRVNRGDALVSTETPVNYFITEQAAGYRCPSLFFIVDNVDFRLPGGANHISAIVSMNLSILVEDRDTFRLTRKAWRYQDALHQILAQDGLTSGDGSVTLRLKIVSASFSPIYSDAQAVDSAQGVFRKEVVLRLEIEHYQSL